ncbi:VCP-like ATPase, partial [Stegodyphus mimosarum]
MDGFGARSKFSKSSSNLKDKMMGHCSDEVIVVAATNRPDLIDDALLRPGRFDVILFVPPPDTEEREEILQTVTEGVPMKDINLKTIAQKTEYFSGADLKNLYQKAALNALRQDISAKFITEKNFVEVLRSMQPSITRQQIEMYERLASKYGPLTSR